MSPAATILLVTAGPSPGALHPPNISVTCTLILTPHLWLCKGLRKREPLRCHVSVVQARVSAYSASLDWHTAVRDSSRLHGPVPLPWTPAFAGVTGLRRPAAEPRRASYRRLCYNSAGFRQLRTTMLGEMSCFR